ncbi:MAG TPA: hypothetical protein VM709_14805, partial [Candidatus Sulfotelmatobacter sp.]|nr:hypothetical protein [Candidatus Sulfotelmatobacter sp.]
MPVTSVKIHPPASLRSEGDRHQPRTGDRDEIGIADRLHRNSQSFIGTLTLAAGAALFPLPALPSRKIEYLEDISDNYRAWREAQIEIVKEGYKIRRASLERPIGGFRRARVHVTDETGTAKTLIWFQPWRGDR